MAVKFAHTLILVKDILESKQFYNEMIGINILHDYGDCVLFENGFAMHTASKFYEYLKKPYLNEKMGRDNVDIYFVTDDLEVIYQKLEVNGVKMIHGIEPQQWGEKVIRFYDPDQHVVEIGDAV
jgi:Lactoylglutathione lyase and related lyases